MNAYAEVLTPSCINSIQSMQFQEKVVKLSRQNATFMSAVEAISYERSTSESVDSALKVGFVLMHLSESLQLLETITSLFPLLKFNNQDQITINFFGRRDTYTRESLKKIYEVLLQVRVGIVSSAKDVITNFSQGVKNLTLLRGINEMYTIIDELDKLLKPCK
jgi:precorrin-3B methylase